MITYWLPVTRFSYVFTITIISRVSIILWACVMMRQNNECLLCIFFSNTEVQLQYLEENISKLSTVTFRVEFQNVRKTFKVTVMNYSPKSLIRIWDIRRPRSSMMKAWSYNTFTQDAVIKKKIKTIGKIKWKFLKYICDIHRGFHSTELSWISHRPNEADIFSFKY